MVTTTIPTGPRCPSCGSKSVYTLIDGTLVCRTCGVRTPATTTF